MRKLKLNSCRSQHCQERGLQFAVGLAVIAALVSLQAAGPEQHATPISGTAPNSQSIPWSDLGTKATAQYSGDGLAVSTAADGTVRLRCAFQRLEGGVTSEGLWLTSTVEGAAADRFRVVADYVGRDGGTMVALPERGLASGEPDLARYVRRGLVEEYSVSVDGVRQDFVVPEPPGGTGPLRVDLMVTGARAEAATDGAWLVLDNSMRKLAYSRLRVVDAEHRELVARLKVVSGDRLVVVVDDVAAVYPVRIDPTFSDANWVSMGGLAGTDGTVYAAVVDAGGNLYIGGSFTFAGDFRANSIARWNGSTWSALGSGVKQNANQGSVNALAIYGADLVVGGYFNTAGGTAARNLARWDGNAWSPLGLGMDGGVSALAVRGTALYAGGSFTVVTNAGPTPVRVNQIAKWDGTAWSPLGSGLNGGVSALVVSGADLYAGGGFTYATNAGSTSVSVNRIAKWDGSAWSALGLGMDSGVRALAVSGTDLYAGGDFTGPANKVAKWDGSAWSALGTGVMHAYGTPGFPHVKALAVSGPDLYVGGDFTWAGQNGAGNIARWNGYGWSTLSTGTDYSYRPVCALAVVGTNLYAGGEFGSAGGVSAQNVAAWNGSAWSPLCSGLNGSVNALATSDTDLYAGGSFEVAGGVVVNNIAKWNGSGWSALGSGMSHTVYALAVSGTDLYAGGYFTTAGGVDARKIAKWNGSAWTALGSGTGYYNDYVYALAVSGTDLYAAGDFSSVGGVPASRIAKWDGTAWSALGSGISGWRMYALAVSGTNLYAGGSFNTAGGVTANNIAKWNGSAWSALGSGTDSEVNALAVSGNDLYAGGYFTTAGGKAVKSVAKWSGSTWSALGAGINGRVSALAASGTNLYAGGSFTTAGGITVSNIALWNGSAWSALGSGVNGDVSALVVSFLDLYAGGSFTRAGDKVSAYVAKAQHAPASGPPVIEVQPTSQTVAVGGTGKLIVMAYGSLPLSYQWRFYGTNLAQQTLASLVLSSVTTNQTGPYEVVVTNALGAVTSAVATLTVIRVPPEIGTQPAGRTVNFGGTATFSVVVGGTEPLSFQWLKNGTALVNGGNTSGVTTPTLTLSGVSGADGSGYRVTITNAQGSVTSQVATLTVVDPLITGQPVSQAREVGQDVSFNVTAVGTVPLAYQWLKNGLSVPLAAGISLSLTNLQAVDAGAYSVVVSNLYGNRTSTVAELSVNLATPDGGFNPGADWVVSSLALEVDGEVLVGGYFSTLGGQSCRWIGRLNPNGTLDSAFDAKANGSVDSLGVQADGRILLGGQFTSLGGQARNRIGRLNPDGTLDSAFNPGADGMVYSLAVQADGKILAGGQFTTLGGQTRNYVGRLNANGTLDSSFNPGADYNVHSLALQADGKILVGGRFTTLGGQPRNYIGRLNANGTLDSSFNPGANNLVYALEVQADGKILVGGSFTTLGGQPRTNICRLNTDGTLDTSFNPGADYAVNSLALQADGKILVGGEFTTLGGQTRRYLGRLNVDGTVDSGFNPEASSYVGSLAVQADGKILVGGRFTTLGGQTRNYIGRLNNSDPATQNLNYNGSTLTWLRGGTSPEVWRTTFESSTDRGASWTGLGAGARIAGGWQLTGVAVLPNANVRARGFTTGGQYNGSGWFTLAILGPPLIVRQPQSQTNDAGTTATLSVAAGGTESLSYQWRFYGTNLVGQTASTLALANLTTNQTGPYTIVVTNALGSITSAVAALTVIPVVTLPEALDAPELVWSSGGAAAWKGQTNVTQDGVDAARSGTVTDGQETWMQTGVAGPGPLSFWWKVSSVSYSDYLEFYTNGVLATRISGEVTWQEVNCALGPGTTVLRWRFFKNWSGSSGQNCGWVDQVNFTPPTGPPVILTEPTDSTVEESQTARFAVVVSGSPPLSYQWRFYGTNLAAQTRDSLVLSSVTTNQAGPYTVVVTNTLASVTSSVATLTVIPVLTLGEALDVPQLTWISGADAPWAGETYITHDGMDAAQCGYIWDYGETWVETSVTGPGPLSFWWKVSSESGYDYLEFYTNGVRVTRISGEADWRQLNYALGSGDQVLRWRYMKDSGGYSGWDCGWVDQVTFIPTNVRPGIPVSDGSFGVKTNRFGFNVTGTAGQIVVVEGSTNLSTWLPLQTNTLGSGPFYFSDPATGAYPWRFYRVRVGP